MKKKKKELENGELEISIVEKTWWSESELKNIVFLENIQISHNLSESNVK